MEEWQSAMRVESKKNKNKNAIDMVLTEKDTIISAVHFLLTCYALAAN